MTLRSENCWLKANQLLSTKKHLQLLATEVFKLKTEMSLELMNDTFHFVERPYNLRSNYTLEGKRDHAVYHGSESLSSLAPKVRDLLPNSIKNSASLKELKTKTNTWAFDRRPCRICKKYVGRAGFIFRFTGAYNMTIYL